MIENLFKKLDRGIRVLVIASMLFSLIAQGIPQAQAAPLAAPAAEISRPVNIAPAAENAPGAIVLKEATPPSAPEVPITSTFVANPVAPLALAKPAAAGKGLADVLADFNGRPVADTAAAAVKVNPSVGGELASPDGRVRISFPREFINQPVQASFQPVTLPQDAAGNAARQALALEQAFELTVSAADGSRAELPEKFKQPVALTMDATGQIEYPLPRGQSLWVGYYDPDAGRWVRVPFEIDRGPAGDQLLLRTQIDHFSTWAYGNNLDAGWLPLFNEPQVALFSGAATYDVPIDVPPGRGGLQPQLNLTYNSRQMEGILAWTQAGWVGLGWNLDLVSIARGIQYHSENGLHECKEELTLIFGGAGYRLVPGERTTTGFRYYTLEYSQLYVERRNNGMGGGSAGNVSGEYWIVRDPQGMEYRVGYAENAEIVKDYAGSCNANPESSLYGGATWEADGRAAFWWHVDQVSDRHGNQMTVDYTEVNEDAAYPDRITYNGGLTQIKFNLGWGGGEGHSRDYAMFFTDRYLDNIVIYQNGAPLQKHQLYYAVNPEAYNFGDIGTRLLTGIQQFDGSGAQAMPKTGFEYMRLDNHPPNGICDGTNWQECFGFPYHRLSRVDNGYGGWTTFSYARDSIPWWLQYSYRVIGREVYDGLHAAPALYQYAYGPGCYDALYRDFYPESGDSPYPADALLCQTFRGNQSHPGRVLGYASVTVMAKDYNGAVLSNVKHSFTTNEGAGPENEYVSKMAGRESKTEWFDPNGALMRAQETEYAVAATPGGWDVRAMGQVERTPDGAGSRYTRTAYAYDTLGNQTAIYEYGAEEYLPNAGFESGLAFWTSSPTGVSLITTPAFAGQNGLLLTQGQISRTLTGLVPGAVYAVRLQLTSQTPGKSITLRVTDAQGLDVSGYFQTGQPVFLTFTAGASSALLSIFGEASIDEVAVARIADVGDERSTQRGFHPNTDAWIVNALAWENVYAGISANVGSSSLKAQTIYYYDDASDYQTPPTVGNLTHVQRGRSGAEWSNTYTRYDGYGNAIAVTDPAGHETTTLYDGSYHVYPVQMTPALSSLAMRSEYYGINVPADGQPVGLLKQVIDPNNQATRYTFDPFGRVTHIFKPGDTVTPSLRYEYRDGPLSPVISDTLLVDNAGFETESAWFTGNATPYAYDATQAHGGSRSLKITFGAGDQWVGNETIAGWYAERVYWVSAWIKTDSAGSLCLHLANKADSEVSAGCWLATGEWQRIQGRFYVPKFSTSFLVLLRGNGVVYVDDVQIGTGLLDNTAPFAAWMPIPNYNFSFEYPGEADTNWRTGGANSTGWGFGESYNGRNGAFLTSNADGGDAWLGNWGITEGWQAGARYGVSVWAKAASGTQQVCLRLVDGNYVEVAGDANTCRTVGAEWQLVSGFIVSLPDAAPQGLLLRLMTAGTVLFDDVKIWRMSAPKMEIGAYARDDADAAVGGTQWSRRVFDGWGRVIQTQAEKDGDQAIVISTEYNAMGQVVQTTAPVEQYSPATGYRYLGFNWSLPKTTTQYDALGRKLSVIPPDGAATSTEYRGFTTAVIDARGNRHESDEDGLGRTVVMREPSGVSQSLAATTYAYDILDQLVRITDALTHTTVITYNSLGQKVAMDDPDMGHWQYSYDPAGNLITQTDAKGQSLTFDYDAANRLTAKRTATGTLATYAYDEGGTAGYALGRRTSMVDATGSSAWRYDARGRVIGNTKTIAGVGTYTTTYAYDSADRVSRMTYPTGETVTQTYSAAGQLNSVTGQDPYLANAVYDVAGRLAQVALGNALNTVYTYYPRTEQGARLQSIQTGALQHLQYTYDPTGNVSSINDLTSGFPTSGETLIYAYDAFDRLTGVTGAYTETYTYDLVGNIRNKDGRAYAYTDPTHVHAVTNAGGDAYAYDANGNMIRRSEDGVVYTQTFDIENRLIAVTSSVSGTTGFKYDGDGARVAVVKPNGDAVYNPIAGYEEEVRQAPLPPLPPTGLRAIYAGGAVTLTWQPAMAPADATFNVYRDDVGLAQMGGMRSMEMHLIASGLIRGFYVDETGEAGDLYAVTLATAAGESAPSTTTQAHETETLSSIYLPLIQRSGVTFAGSNTLSRMKSVTSAQAAVIQRTTYALGPQATAVRVSGDPNPAKNGLFYVHADHLGSAGLTTDAQGNVVARQSYRPYGEVRSGKAVGAMPTNAGYTGQRLDDTGLMYYNARYYSPKLGRFISADTIVPGRADGSGSAAATLGYDKRSALRPLTVDFHETAFLAGLNAENVFTERYGFWFQLDQNGRQKAKYPWGPLNPQALNRYAYVLGNPVRYTDPSGHYKDSGGDRDIGYEFDTDTGVCTFWRYDMKTSFNYFQASDEIKAEVDLFKQFARERVTQRDVFHAATVAFALQTAGLIVTGIGAAAASGTLIGLPAGVVLWCGFAVEVALAAATLTAASMAFSALVDAEDNAEDIFTEWLYTQDIERRDDWNWSMRQEF